MVATSADVARLAGVSRPTVSRILNGRGDLFAVQTRAKVQAAAVQLGYRPSLAARALSKGVSDTVIVVVPDATVGQHLQDTVDLLAEQLAERDLTLLVYLQRNSSDDLSRMIAGLRPRVLLTLGALSPEQLEVVKSSRAEVIFAGGDDWQAENARIGAVQAQYLLDSGRRAIGYAHLRDQRTDPFGEAREAGLRDRLAGESAPEPIVLSTPFDIDGAISALQDTAPSLDAIACYNDDVAIALLAAARELGIRVPEQLAIIGVDDIPTARMVVPALTTVRADTHLYIEHLAQTLLLSLDGFPPPQRLDASFTVVERASA